MIAAGGAALIAVGADLSECCGIERESGNITAILPQTGKAARAALLASQKQAQEKLQTQAKDLGRAIASKLLARDVA